MTHTPGPWVVQGKRILSAADDPPRLPNGEIRDDVNTLVATVANAGSFKTTGNARLIAAAPDLLEALELCENALGSEKNAAEQLGIQGRGVYGIIRAAIAKARGEKV